MNSLLKLLEAVENFLSSKSSLTNDLTTLIPATFSCTDSLRASYLLKTLLKMPIANLAKTKKTMAITGMAATNIHAIFPPVTKAITAEKMSIKGALITIRMTIANDC